MKKLKPHASLYLSESIYRAHVFASTVETLKRVQSANKKKNKFYENSCSPGLMTREAKEKEKEVEKEKEKQ